MRGLGRAEDVASVLPVLVAVLVAQHSREEVVHEGRVELEALERRRAIKRSVLAGGGPDHVKHLVLVLAPGQEDDVEALEVLDATHALALEAALQRVSEGVGYKLAIA